MIPTILDSIFIHSNIHPNKVALVSGEDRLTYGELGSKILLRASTLKGLGVSKHSRQIVFARHSFEFVVNYFACHFLGATAVVLDPSISKGNLRVIKTRLNIGDIITERLSKLSSENNFGRSDQEQVDDADLLFTSGTTALPKGVLLTHQNIYTSAMRINRFIGIRTEDIELIMMPLCHSFGLTRLRCALLGGLTCVLIDGFSRPKRFFKALSICANSTLLAVKMLKYL